MAEEREKWAKLGALQRRLVEQLQGDLVRQLKDDLALPAAAAIDEAGEIRKGLMPLDTGGRPVSDEQIARAVRGALGDGNTVALGFVRVDLDVPELISLDLGSGLVVEALPVLEGQAIEWHLRDRAQLSSEPRGGSSGETEEGATLMRRGMNAQIGASQALRQIGNDALENLEREVAGAQSVEDISDELMLDAGEVWQHRPVPEAAPSMALDERLRQLRDHARSLPTTTTAVRFLHRGQIYLFGYYEHADQHSAFLTRTGLEGPGRLSAIESVPSGELAALLGDS